MAGTGPPSVIVGLWAPVFVFAHIFAGFWIFKAWLLKNPQSAEALRRLLGRGSSGSSSSSDEQQQQQQQQQGGKQAGDELDSAVLTDATETIGASRVRGERSGEREEGEEGSEHRALLSVGADRAGCCCCCVRSLCPQRGAGCSCAARRLPVASPHVKLTRNLNSF